MQKQLFLIFFLLSSYSMAFDHSYKDFNEILKQNVTFVGHQSSVDYKSLKKSPEVLNLYLKTLSKVKMSEYQKFSSDERLSFLINAYNAFTLKLIVDHYPVKSIKDIGSLFTSAWKKEFFELFGEKFYLDKIEHEMIRKDFKEPRIHFAVNCASVGCPSLANEAFVASKLNSQLDVAAKNFILNKKKNFLKQKTLHLSKIFKWYGGDFNHIGGYKKFVSKIMNIDTPKAVEFLDYDWNLNSK